jgi:hypothetical protein
MTSFRPSAGVFLVLATMAGCHLIGGLDGLARGDEDDSGVGASGGAPTTSVGPGGTGGDPSSSSAGGGLPMCDPVACADSPPECKICECLQGLVCDCNPVASASPCDNGNGVCDTDGTCVDCLTSLDCLDPLTCVGKTCVEAQCTDGLPNGDETGTDCGGSCAPCGINQGCTVDDDCITHHCNNFVCANCGAPTSCNGDYYCLGGSCAAQKGGGQSCTDDAADYECTTDDCVCGIVLGFEVCGCAWF